VVTSVANTDFMRKRIRNLRLAVGRTGSSGQVLDRLPDQAPHTQALSGDWVKRKDSKFPESSWCIHTAFQEHFSQAADVGKPL
jgi:hypothetical protein